MDIDDCGSAATNEVPLPRELQRRGAPLRLRFSFDWLLATTNISCRSAGVFVASIFN